MKANPGGIVSPDNVIGRDRLIERLWKTLEQRGLVLVAERRMGKTAIVKKMEAEPSPNKMVLWKDVEAVSSPAEFVERLAQDINAFLSALRQTENWIKSLWASLGGTEICGMLKLPQSSTPYWKAHLERILGEFAQRETRPIILIWDEFPWMLQKIAHRENSFKVVELLDTLRGLRQEHANLRMVYTGSIGLHHVLNSLHDEGYVNEPDNDMSTIEIPPLDHPDAVELARALIRGEGLVEKAGSEESIAGVAETIAALSEGVPFYIHHIVAALADEERPATRQSVEEVVAKALIAPQNPWDLEHFRKRLPSYYGERARLVRAVLDRLAEEQPLGLDDLHEKLKIAFHPDNEASRRVVDGDREGFRELVKLMQRDHYLLQEQNGKYRFYLNLIRRWWRIDMGIS